MRKITRSTGITCEDRGQEEEIQTRARYVKCGRAMRLSENRGKRSEKTTGGKGGDRGLNFETASNEKKKNPQIVGKKEKKSPDEFCRVPP